MVKTSGKASFLITIFQFLQYYVFVGLFSDVFALFHRYLYCDSFIREKIAFKTFFVLKYHLAIIWRLLCLVAKLSDGLKIMDPSFITCDDIGKLSFCHKLETCEAAFWPL